MIKNDEQNEIEENGIERVLFSTEFYDQLHVRCEGCVAGFDFDLAGVDDDYDGENYDDEEVVERKKFAYEKYVSEDADDEENAEESEESDEKAPTPPEFSLEGNPLYQLLQMKQELMQALEEQQKQITPEKHVKSFGTYYRMVFLKFRTLGQC